jgi:MarR family transcriptional regulator, transcriptional regulator for hemolysin
MIVKNSPRPLLRHRSVDRRCKSYPRGQRDPAVSALLTFSFLRETRLYVRRLEQRVGALGLTLPECNVLLYLANHEGICQVRLAELMNLEQMSLVRCLDGLESFGCLERRRYPADRRAHCIYFKVMGKSLVDQIWRLMNVTDREAFAGIPRKHRDVMIEILEKIRGNLAALQALPQRALGDRPRKRNPPEAASRPTACMSASVR